MEAREKHSALLLRTTIRQPGIAGAAREDGDVYAELTIFIGVILS